MAHLLTGSLMTLLPLSEMMNWIQVSNATGQLSNATDTPATNSFPGAAILNHILPYGLSQIILALIIKNQDFLKLMILGGLIETFRRYSSRVREWLMSRFYIVVHFDKKDETYRMHSFSLYLKSFRMNLCFSQNG